MKRAWYLPAEGASRDDILRLNTTGKSVSPQKSTQNTQNILQGQAPRNIIKPASQHVSHSALK